MANFQEVAPNRGVDSLNAGAAWMMVPLFGSNLVCLRDGVGYSVPESVGKRLTVQKISAKEIWGVWNVVGTLLAKDARFFRVGGLNGGPATVEAKKKGQPTITLNVSVHPRRSFKVAFFFLQDKDAAGNVKPRTAFTPLAASGWIGDLNNVYGPQANIWFEKGKSELLPLADLSAEVGTEKDLSKLGAIGDTSGAHISIFLAGSSISPLDTRDHPNGFYHIPTKVIVVRDQFVADSWAGPAAPMLATIAHEIGHFMNYKRGAGEGHDFYAKCGYSSDILNTIDGTDIKIPHQRVLDWNPW
jgi:hypothetical protein